MTELKKINCVMMSLNENGLIQVLPYFIQSYLLIR